MKRTLFIIGLLLFPAGTFAAPNWSSYPTRNATSCTVANLQSELNTLASTGGTLILPACDVNWGSSPTDALIKEGLTKPLRIMGAGIGVTIIRRPAPPTTNKTALMDLRWDSTAASPTNRYVEITGISFEGNRYDASNQQVQTALWLYRVYDFRVHNCEFRRSWWHGGAIGLRNVFKGLIDNNTFLGDYGWSGASDWYFGVSTEGTSYPVPGSPTSYTCNGLFPGGTSGLDYNSCSAYYTTDDCASAANPTMCQKCIDAWECWWDDAAVHGGFGFNENYQPGTDNAIFIESNYFYGAGPAYEGNWGGGQAVVFRYNIAKVTPGDYGRPYASKMGGVFSEVYNNKFICETGGCNASRFRDPGVMHHNSFTNFEIIGYREYGWCSYGYCWTPQTMPTQFIYSNVFDNVGCIKTAGDPTGTSSSLGESKECWGWDSTTPSAMARLGENKSPGWYFRAPQAGDRIYPYTPYVYPHPKAISNSGGVFKKPNPPILKSVQ